MINDYTNSSQQIRPKYVISMHDRWHGISNAIRYDELKPISP